MLVVLQLQRELDVVGQRPLLVVGSKVSFNDKMEKTRSGGIEIGRVGEHGAKHVRECGRATIARNSLMIDNRLLVKPTL